MVQSSVNLSVFSKNTLNECPWQRELLYIKGDSAIIQCHSFTEGIKTARHKHKPPLCSWSRHLKTARGWSLPELQ